MPHAVLDDRFGPLADLLHHHVERGVELGASICVVHDGRVVADLWDGWTDDARTSPWQADTLVNVWSITKTVTNLAALVLADRGEIDLDAPVADYWPEFAAHGKQGVLVRHLLGHTSGVPGWAQPVTVEDLYDWTRSTAMLAAQEPWWEPGTAGGYHLIDQGHLVGEVLRRVSGLMPGELVAKELSVPLGADFHIGLAREEHGRVTDVVPPVMIDVDTAGIDPHGIPVRTFTGPFLRASEANTERWRMAEVPAANGHGNARSVARIQSVVSHAGEVDGTPYLSPATIDRIFEVQARGTDLVLEMPLTFGIGFGLPEPRSVPSVAPGRRCYWAGLGGSFVLNDLENRLTFAYTMNRMIYEHAPGTRKIRPAGDSRSDAYIAATYAALGLDPAVEVLA